ncbi:MAG: SRPBCC family protein [Pseudomonadota bacterium]|nr:SRPBCC family protein [Pseudomonadota bacterium]
MIISRHSIFNTEIPMVNTLLLVLAIGIAAVLIYAAFKSKSFALSRSAVIAAPTDRVFALINDLQGFNRWNPFAKQDPEMKIQYESVTSGKGAAYSWIGKKAGVGRMEITDSAPMQHVTMKLDFSKPMEAHNTVNFTLEPQSANTRVTWAMTGSANYAQNLIMIFFSMEKMVGRQFEAGLASLKALAEQAS